jgi:hypothetical protein
LRFNDPPIFIRLGLLDIVGAVILWTVAREPAAEN